MLSALNEAKEGNAQPLHNMISRYGKHKEKEDLEMNMFLKFVEKRKKAKKRDEHRVVRNYIKVCRSIGIRPYGYLTEDEIERERYGGGYYGFGF